MKNRETIKEILSQCIQSHNEQAQDYNKIAFHESTLLLAEGSSIDSIELVNIIVDFEEALTLKFGKIVSLTSDESLMTSETPFESVKTLCDYACAITG